MTFFSIHNQEYHRNEAAVEFLTLNQVFSSEKICICRGTMNLCINKRASKDNIIYRCINANCRKRLSIFKGTLFERCRYELFDIMLMLNFYLHDIRNFAVVNFVGCTETTYIDYKKIFLKICKRIAVDDIGKIGRNNIRVQVDGPP
jgi:hypothetical protein